MKWNSLSDWRSKSSITLICAIAFAGKGRAQGLVGEGSPRIIPRQITAPVKYAGVYHLGTGQWTRPAGAPHSLLGSSDSIIYNNTCQVGYYFPLEQNMTLTDEGEVPSTTGLILHSTSIAGGFDSHPGCQDAYQVTGFQIAYCTDQAAVDVSVGFQDHYTFCTAPAATQLFALQSLPGSAVVGTEACWTVDIDLSSSSTSFALLADGNGAYDGTGLYGNSNWFGWTISFTSLVGTAGGTGPLMAGDFATCTGTDGTCWDQESTAPPPIWPANMSSGQTGGPEFGTGMASQDLVYLYGSTYQGCFSGGPALAMRFHLLLFAVDGCPTPSPMPFCPGDGSLPQPCPCGNSGASGSGCANSSNSSGALISAGGSTSPDTLALSAAGEPPTASSVLLQGTWDTFVPFGDGVRCVSGNLKRLFVRSATSGAVSFPPPGGPSISARSAILGDPIQPGTMRSYQIYYRDANTGFCPPPQGNSWNVTNGMHVPW